MTEHLHQIVPGLYLGDIRAGWNPYILKNYNIAAVLQIFGEDAPMEVRKIERLVLKMDDDPEEDIFSVFDDTYDWIESKLEKKQNILIHCYAGISRSATIVIAYLIKRYKMTYEDAHRFVLKKRDVIDPNFGFIIQLMFYQKKLLI